MVAAQVVEGLQSIVTAAETILLVFPSDANRDLQASVVAFQDVLKSVGKTAKLLSPQPPEELAFQELSGVAQELGQDNLVITFPYSLEKVDKVSYNIDETSNQFYLTIKPRAGITPLETSEISFKYTGASADAIILVGITELESLEQIYFGYEELFSSVPTFVVSEAASQFGTYHLETSGFSSASEAVSQLMTQAQYQVSSDAATALLTGIEDTTQNFSSRTASAETFETVASLLRAGARRGAAHKKEVLVSATPVKKEVKKVLQKK